MEHTHPAGPPFPQAGLAQGRVSARFLISKWQQVRISEQQYRYEYSSQRSPAAACLHIRRCTVLVRVHSRCDEWAGRGLLEFLQHHDPDAGGAVPRLTDIDILSIPTDGRYSTSDYSTALYSYFMYEYTIWRSSHLLSLGDSDGLTSRGNSR